MEGWECCQIQRSKITPIYIRTPEKREKRTTNKAAYKKRASQKEGRGEKKHSQKVKDNVNK